jgi:hypothetical protein
MVDGARAHGRGKEYATEARKCVRGGRGCGCLRRVGSLGRVSLLLWSELKQRCCVDDWATLVVGPILGGNAPRFVSLSSLGHCVVAIRIQIGRLRLIN